MSGNDDIPTPRQTGSWAVSIGRSQALITRLERAIYALESPNPVKRNPEQAERCRIMQEALRAMIIRFEQWPTKPRDEVEKERPLLTVLGKFSIEVDEICRRLGPSY